MYKRGVIYKHMTFFLLNLSSLVLDGEHDSCHFASTCVQHQKHVGRLLLDGWIKMRREDSRFSHHTEK
jgi:hypothetical protein